MQEAAVEQAGEVRSARVESLRAIAALGVVLAHVMGRGYVYQIPDDALHKVLFSGSFAVNLFFVLTGYLLFWPFVKRDYGDGRRIDRRRYGWNRALRILPLYYVVLVPYMVVVADGGSVKKWLAFLTFSENFFEQTVMQVNPVLWSLVIELHFYLVLPPLAFLLARLSRGSLRAAAVAVVGLGAASFVLRWVTLYDAPGTPNPYLRYSLLSCFMFFASGMALALLRLAWERRRPRLVDGWLGAPATWMVAAVGIWLVMALDEGRGYLAAPASFLLVGACVLPLRDGPAVRALEWRPLALVGTASYSLYLWHVLIIRELSGWGVDGFVPLLIVSVPLCIAVAFVSYAAVEQPFLRLRRNWGSTAALTATTAPERR